MHIFRYKDIRASPVHSELSEIEQDLASDIELSQ